ncbi:ATP-binding protein involved in chromosome partitioning, MRP [Pseudohyphozyma bogoriensis]|nr:ATP-binding protein involved in chromosome partitioning, MRP [Pseudohyphozyma bogoriensis]
MFRNGSKRIRLACPLPQPTPAHAVVQHFELLHTSTPRASHSNPLGLPMNNAPPTMPRMQRGLPVKQSIPGAKRVVVVASGKGGVGKSSVSANLALALAGLSEQEGGRKLRVGLLDLDIFGPSVPKLMGLENMGEPLLSSNNKLLPLRSYGIPCMSMGFLLSPSDPDSPTSNEDTAVVWRGMMVMKAVQQLLFDVDWTEDGKKEPLDVLVVDTPPGTGDVSLSLGQLVKVDGSVVVTTPQNVAVLDTRKGIAMFRKLNIPILGMLLNMSYLSPPTPTSPPQYIFGPPTKFNTTCAELGLEKLAELEICESVSERGDSGVPLVVRKNGEEEGSGAEGRVRGAFVELAKKVWSKVQ